MRKLKSRGFTDKLYFLNLTLSWLFILICIVMTALEEKLGITDMSLVSVGIPAVFAELGVHTGFIVWKAKTENINKHGYNVDNGDVITNAMGFQVDPIEQEDNDDNNIIHNDADDRCGCDLSIDGSNKESIFKFWKRIFR